MTARLAATFVLAAAATLSAGSQQASFATRIEAVRVDVLVTDQGQPVRGLTRSDFEVIDNGVPQQVDLVSFEQIPLNAILAFDMSDSVAGDRLDRLQAAGRAVLSALKTPDQAALVTFSHAVVLGAPLARDLGPVRAAVDRAEGSGNTALVDGTYAAMMLGESDVGRALLIIFSDGVDTASWLSADAVLDIAKRSDVVAYAVAVRSAEKPDFLRDLTALTGGRLFEVEKATNLSTIFLTMLEEFRQRYLVSYTPRGVTKDGWHRLEVRVKHRGAIVKARPGYLAGP